jgi:hypothetical protein
MLQTFRTGHDPTCQDLGSCRLRFYLKTERAVPGAHSHRREKFSHEALANDPNAAAGVGFVPMRAVAIVDLCCQLSSTRRKRLSCRASSCLRWRR